VDDASSEGNVAYLLDEWRAGRVHHLLLRHNHYGAMANLNAGAWMAFSDPTVFLDDDVLCPDVEPDWLARGTTEMQRHPELAMLALNHPGAKKKDYHQSGNVTYCKSLGGTFLFMRRKFLMSSPYPHVAGELTRPLESRCIAAREQGWKIAYLTHTYCYHIGEYSELTGKDYQGRFIEPLNWTTLEPPTKYAK